MTETTAKAKASTRKVKIKSMNGKYATGGLFVAPGAKIGPGDVCEIPPEFADSFKGDMHEFTNAAANCKVVKVTSVTGGMKYGIDRG